MRIGPLLLVLNVAALVPDRRLRVARVRGVVISASASAAEAEAAVAYVNEAAPALVRYLAMQGTTAGSDVKRANAVTGGSAELSTAQLATFDADGLELRTVVSRKRQGVGEPRLERVSWSAILADEAPRGAAAAANDDLQPVVKSPLGPVELQLALMQVAAASGLERVAAALLRMPGGLDDWGALPDGLWLNNVPASREVRAHFADGVVTAVFDALDRGRRRSILTIQPPELDVSMDTFRVGTLLELVRTLVLSLVATRGVRVRVCVQGPMGVGIFAGMPLSLNGVAKLLKMMDWGEENAELLDPETGYVRFGQVGAGVLAADDDVIFVISPQSIVGNSVVPLLAELADEAGDRPVFLFNPRLDDIQSAQGVMSVRGRGERMAFAQSFDEVYHFSLVVPPGRTFFPILGAIKKARAGAPYVLSKRTEVLSDPTLPLKDSIARFRAAQSGELREIYAPVAAYAELPDAKQTKAGLAEVKPPADNQPRYGSAALRRRAAQ